MSATSSLEPFLEGQSSRSLSDTCFSRVATSIDRLASMPAADAPLSTDVAVCFTLSFLRRTTNTVTATATNKKAVTATSVGMITDDLDFDSEI